MAKNKFIVPKDQQTEFDRLIQRANRRIKANLKYIQQEDIKSESATRSLVSDYNSPSNWHTQKTVFSRSKVFESEREYKQYRRHVEQWGADTRDFDRSVTKIKQGYYENIIKALTTTAQDNGALINDRLPEGLAEKIEKMTLEQLTNFFGDGDPTEDIENMRWGSDLYAGVDAGEFADITSAHINRLEKLYPAKQKARKARKRK